MTDGTDIAIADYRTTHSEALLSRAHPEHHARVEGLSALFEAKFADGSAAVPASNVPLAEFRGKYGDALQDRAHPDHDVRVDQLTKLTNDAVGGNEPAESLMAAADGPDAYDFSRFKGTVQAPDGVELEQSPELEQQARTWMADGGLSKAEGEAMASIYGQSFSWSESDVARIAQATESGLRQKYGDSAGTVAEAALRIAGETPGLLDFLEQSGLINHWQVTSTLISRAEAKGYFKKGA